MREKSIDLLQYRSNVYSHNGEDGVLGHLLARLPATNKWAVEFGAWDGKWASNTCNLLENFAWNVLYIECDEKKFAELKTNHGANSRAHLVMKFIGFDGANSLDDIFKATPGFPRDPDLVSMDIDGCEYHLWESLCEYKPKIIVVEFNPSIPLDYEYVQPKDFSINHSSGLKAFVELGNRKGYGLVSVLDYNAIFVRADLIGPMDIEIEPAELLFRPFADRYQTRIWQSMDGRLHLAGCDRLIWHNVTINEDKIQILPRFLQVNPAGTGWLRKLLRIAYHRIPFVPELFNFLISGEFRIKNSSARDQLQCNSNKREVRR